MTGWAQLGGYAPHLAVVALALAVYANSLNGELFYDDDYAIQRNKDVTAPHAVPWTHLFSSDYWGMPMADERSHKSFRPLVVLTFRWNHALHGLEPWGYHAVNVAIHALASLLSMLAARTILLGAERPALLAGLLFAAHPVHTEAVAGVVGRAELMCYVAYLGAFLAGARAAQPYATLFGWQLCACLCTAAATLCKETGVTIVGVLFFYDVLYVMNWLDVPIAEPDEAAAQRAGWRWAVRRAHAPLVRCEPRRLWVPFTRQLTYAAFAVLFMAWRISLNGNVLPVWPEKDNPAAASDSLALKLLNYPYIYALNAWLLLWPVQLCGDYTFLSVPMLESGADPRNLASLALAAGLLGACAWAVLGRNVHLPVLGALVLLLVPFLPSSNLFFTVGFLIAERVLYIPSLGFCVALAYALDRLFARPRLASRPALYLMVVALILAGYSARTLARNRDWASEGAFWSSALPVVPHNAKVAFNVGNVHFSAGRYDQALIHFNRSNTLSPNDATTLINMATTLAKLDRLDDAIVQYEAASKLARNLGQFYNWGAILEHRGLYEDAIRVYHMASEIAADGGRLNLYQDDYATKALAAVHEGTLLCRTGRADEGLRRFYYATQLDANQAEAFMRIGLEHGVRGEFDKAVPALQRCLQLEPGNSYAQNELARIRASAGKPPAAASPDSFARTAAEQFRLGNAAAARQAAQAALALDPQHRGAMGVSAALLVGEGRYDDALELFERLLALEADAPTVDTLYNYAVALQSVRRTAEAAELYERLLRLDENHAAALANLGATRFAAGRVDDAERLLKRAISLEPSSIALRNLAKIYLHSGRTPHAVKALRRAVALDASNPEPAVDLARVLAEQGEQREARQVLGRHAAHSEARSLLAVLPADNDDEL